MEKNKYTKEIEKLKNDVEKIKPKTEEETKIKEDVIKELSTTKEIVDESSNYKTNKIKDISKKERKILHVITDILSDYLAKEEVDEVINRIQEEMTKGGK